MNQIEKPLTTREIRDYAQIIITALFLIFTIYTNSMKVPRIEENVASLNVRETVIESRIGTIQQSLDRIENAVTRRPH